MEEINEQETGRTMKITEIPDNLPEEEPVKHIDNQGRPKPGKKGRFNAVRIIAMSAAVLIVILVAAKIIIFKSAPPDRDFPLKHVQSVNKKGPYPDITEAPGNNNGVSSVKPASLPTLPPVIKETGAGPSAAVNTAPPLKKTNIQTNAPGGQGSALIPLPGNIKEILKYNTEINTLKKKAKIAQLEQEINNLHTDGGPGQVAGGGIAQPNITLVAITKKTALIAFGKTDVLMTPGMKYDGYECLIVTGSTAALEKNHRVINLNLSM